VLHKDNSRVGNAVLKSCIRVRAYRSIFICTYIYIYMGSNLYIRLSVYVCTHIKFCLKQVGGYRGANSKWGLLFWSLLYIYVHIDLYIYILYVCLNIYIRVYIYICTYICTHIQFCSKQVVGYTGAIHTLERCLGAFYVHV